MSATVSVIWGVPERSKVMIMEPLKSLLERRSALRQLFGEPTAALHPMFRSEPPVGAKNAPRDAYSLPLKSPLPEPSLVIGPTGDTPKSIVAAETGEVNTQIVVMNVVQSESTVLILQGVYAGLPFTMLLLAAFVFRGFSLTADKHAHIRATLDRRAATSA